MTDPDTPTGASAPSVLEYFPERSRSGSSVTAFYLLTGPLWIGLFLAKVGLRALALPGIVLTAAFVYFKHRRKQMPLARLCIRGGRLHLDGRDCGRGLEIALTDLLDVSLDTKEIQRVQDNPTGFLALTFMSSTIGPKVDTARIELETRSGSIFLSRDRVSYLDSSEWTNRIRRFLRSNGWTPHGERATGAT